MASLTKFVRLYKTGTFFSLNYQSLKFLILEKQSVDVWFYQLKEQSEVGPSISLIAPKSRNFSLFNSFL